MNCKIKSLYLCVKDMDRAIAFYEKFFEKPVTIKSDIYSIFDIDGFSLGLFAFEKVHEEHTYGSNCLPSIEVESIEVLRKKLSGLKIVFELKIIGEYWVSEFEDSEGNHIELTTLVNNER